MTRSSTSGWALGCDRRSGLGHARLPPRVQHECVRLLRVAGGVVAGRQLLRRRRRRWLRRRQLPACDSASRFNASATGLNVAPAWSPVHRHGLAVLGRGHLGRGLRRWPPALAEQPVRPGQRPERRGPASGHRGARPANGVPLAWNPGRNPRGHGTAVIYASKTGVWFGSDTNCIGPGAGNSCVGPNTYPRDELAFFPYSPGGTPAGANNVGAGTRIIKIGARRAHPRTASTPPTVRAARSPTPSSGIRLEPGPRRVLARRQRLLRQGRTGTSTSGPTAAASGSRSCSIDPYDDPAWDSVLTGSPTGSLNTYQGVKSSFYTDIPHITAMFYANRSIYYTLAG